jgi:predicted nuclease with TOPRIM domain
MGINGIFVLLAVFFALLGLAAGRTAIGNIIQQLSEEQAKTERLVTELASLNARLTQELAHRMQAGQALKEDKAALEDMNKVMMNREGRIVEIKKEINDLFKELGRPPRYQL